MSDFRTQFVSRAIASASSAITAQAPADFSAVNDAARSFLINTCTLSSAGIGRTTGSLPGASLANVTAEVSLDDQDSATFTHDLLSGINRDNLCAAQLLEYAGPIGGPNEIVSRGDFVITLANGETTNSDSSTPAIAGIVNFAKCVPFGAARCAYNSSDLRAHLCKVDLVDTGTKKIVKVTRANGSGTMTVRVRVAEFGSAWSVQRVPHVFAASNAPEDETITSVETARSFTYSSFLPSTTGSATPKQQNYFVWLSGSTTLRHRIREKATAAPSCVTWVISHPQLAVTLYGTPDGTADITALGASPESKTVTITAVPDINQALVLGYAGGDTSDVSGNMCAWWMLDLQSTTTIRLRRTGHDTAANRGDTEYVLQVIDFSQIVSARIDSVTAITDGSSFTISGVFGASPTVTHGGDAVAVTGSTGTSITCTGSLGDKRYGRAYELKVVDASSGTATTEQPIFPAAGTRYVDLVAPLAPPSQRITGDTLDVAGGDQIEWTSADTVGSGVSASDVDMFSNGAFRWAAPAVTAQNFRAHRDGQGWGAKGLQTFEAPLTAPVVTTIPDFIYSLGIPLQIAIGAYGSGWISIALIGPDIDGIDLTAGNLLLVDLDEPADYVYVARFTNEHGSTDSNLFHIRFQRRRRITHTDRRRRYLQ